MSYFILGSNSFAGSCFVDFLLARKEKVIGVSRSSPSHPVLTPYFDCLNKKNYDFFQLDLNHHSDEIYQLIQKNKPTYIVDFAGQGMVAESWDAPWQWYTTNIVSKVKLHHFLKTCDFLERYVRISTPEVYGPVPHLIREEQAYLPSTPYAVSHAAIDMSLITFYKQFNFPVTLVRFANFYGPYQQLYRIIPRAIIYAFLGRKLQLQGGGLSKRAFIYGSDVAEGIYQSIHRGKPGEVYHFSGERCITIAELVNKICAQLAIEVNSFVETVPDRPGKDNQYEMDDTKARTLLAWKPQHSLYTGISKTIDWVKENIRVIETLPLNYIHQP